MKKLTTTELIDLRDTLYTLVDMGRIEAAEADDILSRAGLTKTGPNQWIDEEGSTYTLK
jgi:hypothetical protein